MTSRLKAVIDELYRPAQRRKVFALSRAEAESLPRLPTTAVISITAPERPPANLDGFEHLLRLSFADVDHLGIELSARAREKVSKAFTVDQAEQVLSFVTGLPPGILSIVAHCEGGYSRSCAVAYVLNELYGYTVEFERLQNANPSVVKMLRKAAATHTKR
ncbi:hypothetical protein [Polaromonas naphthalenivorans]|uniref:Tyrosine specific protein phosphatases domain-containing protein n=1 Tax=Polaromonas naphthalenivorans (strain CJ2) TaxID=365044 RepID=A1VWE0_POLNA|nr:hypothetical protein [Polaromonas naphthalenivorans]ABM39968.1 hypothetical protein Pnap_4904 [Polaromonas naphthalenivorans CJ2]